MKPIARVFRYLKHYPKEIVANVLFNALAVVFSLFSFVLIIPFVELLFGMTPPPSSEPPLAFNQESLTQWMLWQLYTMKDALGATNSLLAVSAAYLACSLLGNVSRYLGLYFLAPIRNGIVQRLRDDIYRRITILPVGYFNSRRRGDILSRLSNDLFDIEWSVVSTMQNLVKDPINILLFAGTLIFISPKLFLLILLILPLFVFLISSIAKSLKRNSVKGQAKLGVIFSELEENLSGMRAIHAFGREKSRQQHFETTNNDYARTMVRVAQRRELSSPLSEVLGTVGLMVILILGGGLVLRGEMASSVFIFFVIVFTRLISPTQAVVKAYNSLVKGSAAAARVFEIIDADEQIVEAPHAFVLKDFEHGIELHDVGFSYQEEGSPIDVLQHIDLAIPKGKTIALVGPSGAGKSTLADLLPRFYDCTRGDILIDSHPLREVNIHSLRSLFGIVSQTCILFNDTVAANIAFGRRGATQQQIETAAALAYADEFIRQLPKGYDTVVGDMGVTLSGGQRQRLSIARALLKDPPILILDEATSALDNESELLVQQALAQLMRQRTCLIIAHRLSTIRNADEIVAIEGGHIVQQGTHDQLMQEDGLYKKLVDMQQFA
ncbi:MAG: ABC transporter ATP-binding protein [Bacteroidales bacterium]|nr:ABC transporter ATP-binding protein [Bacteroidales bacterium]